MKKLLFATALFFSLNIHAIAQQEIEACNNFFQAGNYERAIQMGEIAVKKYPDDVRAHYCLGKAYHATGELKLALASFMQAEKLTQDKKNLVFIYNMIGGVYDDIGNLDDALFYYFRALNLAKELGDKEYEATLLNNIGGIYKDKGDYDKALSYYEDSLSLKQSEIDKAPTYNNIAVLYTEKGENEKALEYFFKALDIRERYGDYHGAARTLLNIGEVYRKVKDYEKAEQYLFEGLSRIRRVGDKYWEGFGLECIGWLYKDLGNRQKAIEYFTSAYNLYKSIGAERRMRAVREELLKLGVDPEKPSVEQKQEQKTNEKQKKKGK